MRYVERNALRANLVDKAEEWRWSSLWRRTFGTDAQKLLLSDWPLPEPSRWKAHVNAAQSELEVQAVRQAIRRGCLSAGAQKRADMMHPFKSLDRKSTR